MFERAARLKLRFSFKGLCTVEDLWDLTVEELDSIFKTLNKKLKEQEGESLLETKTSDDEALELKIDIIKHIVNVKQEERRQYMDQSLKASKKKKLLEIIAMKQDEQYKSMSLEDLNKLIDVL